MKIDLYNMDCKEMLKRLPDKLINTCVTSPPYWGLRNYEVEGQIGLEETPEKYVRKIVSVFRQVRRVLRDDATVWLNLGDCYAGFGKGGNPDDSPFQKQSTNKGTLSTKGRLTKATGKLKPKDLIGIPWRCALALQADGWYLRSDIVWCLSGGTWIYAKTQKGEMPMMIRDMARLDPKTVKLWNGEKWTQVKGFSKLQRMGNEIEFVLRSGERISCTPTHKFLTNRGLVKARDILVGDIFQKTILPQPQNPKDSRMINIDIAWFIGLYLAEGSRSNDCIQIAGHSKEKARWEILQNIASLYGGYITRTVDKNKMNIRLYGKILNAFLDEFISGKTAKNKCLSPICWYYSNDFLKSLLMGYLSGDGHWDKKNKRWRLGFTRNYNLERDLRTLSARLDFDLTLNISNSFIDGKKYPSFRGEIRFEKKKHWNTKEKNEIVEIRKARCREVYDIGVKDKPHLFALSSGILTHNSKPNTMPESVTDRPTKSHEYIFLLSKSKKYYYDAEAIKEECVTYDNSLRDRDNTKLNNTPGRRRMGGLVHNQYEKRNKRDVWEVPTSQFKGAHFATFPEKLIEPCILAGCPKGGIVLDPFMGSGTTGIVAFKHERGFVGSELNQQYFDIAKERILSLTAQQDMFREQLEINIF